LNKKRYRQITKLFERNEKIPPVKITVLVSYIVHDSI